MKDRKLLVVIGGLGRGGCERHLLYVLPELVKRGYNIEIFLLSGGGELISSMEEAGISVCRPIITSSRFWQSNIIFRVFRLFVASCHFTWHLLTHRPSIVHFFLPASYIVGAPIALLASRSRKAMSRRSLNNYMDKRPVIRLIEAWLHQRMDVVMGNSSSVVQQLLFEERSPTERTGLIYNGVSPIVHSTSTQTELRDELNLSNKECVFTIVANLIPYKGHADLIEAFKIVANRTTQNWKLLIVGRDDGIGGYLRALVVGANLTQNIVFLNARADARAILSVSDVGLLVSHEEGFSNAILEGMVEGLPMIVTDVGGNREAVDDEETGLIVSARNPEALARSIIHLLENPSVRMEMGKKAKKRAFEKFSLARCVDQYDHLYTSLFSTNGQYTLNELLRDADRMAN